MRPVLAVGLLALAVGGCATTPDSCRGFGSASKAIALPDPARASVRELQCGSDLGIRHASLELARRYENGVGVQADQRAAARSYMRAATPVAAYTHVYAPPVRLGGRGQVLILPSGRGSPGDAEAQYRLALMRLEGRGIVRSPERAVRLLRLAAAQGHQAAAEALTRLELRKAEEATD